MKFVLSGSIFIAMLLTASCKKDDDSADNSVHGLGAILLNSWVIGNKNYKVTSVQVTGGQVKGIQVKDSLTDTFTFTFNGAALPLTAGKYKIVAANPAPDQVVVSATTNSGITYTATGNDNAYANVFNASDGSNILGNFIGVSTIVFWAKSSLTATDSITMYGAVARK